MAVPRFRITIDTPGSTAPELSCTTPTILPVLVCAEAVVARKSSTHQATRWTERVIEVITPPECGSGVHLAAGLSKLHAVGRCPRGVLAHEPGPRGAVGDFFHRQVDQLRDLFNLR